MKKIMFRLISVVLSLSLALGTYFNADAAGNVYYVSTNGNDSNAGISAAPFKTIQKCADVAGIGDTCLIQAGNYNERVTVSRDGVMFQAGGYVVIKGFSVSASNTLMDGFYSFSNESNSGAFDLAGNNNVVRNSVIENSCMVGIVLRGNGNLAEGNEIFDSRQCGGSGPDADGIRMFADGNIARSNYVHDISLARNPTAHIDCIQSWGTLLNATIENNYCSVVHAGIQTDVGNVHNIVIRNNVFMSSRPLNMRGEGLIITNNTFIGVPLETSPDAYILFQSSSNITFQRNIIYNTTEGILTSVGSVTAGGYNIFYNPGGVAPRRDSGYNWLNGKLNWSTDKWQTVDPLFVNAAAKDYHLQSGSPACVAGENGKYIGAFPCDNVTPSPTPTATTVPFTPTSTATNSPTPTATAIPFTPTLTATNSPTPTATAVPFTPTPTATNSPTPTATTVPFTPTPTAANTALPTATSQSTATPESPIVVSDGENNVDVRVAKGNDDVEENSFGRMYINSRDLELIYDNNAQVVGMRFSGAEIPKGAMVTNAYIQFKVAQTSGKTIKLTVSGEASANASAFSTTARNVSKRVRTSNSVTWTPPSWSKVGEMGTSQRTPNLNSIIQEIINQPNWNSGNSIVLIISGKNGKRIAKSFEGDSAGAPLLHVEFSVPVKAAMALLPTSTPTPTPTATLITPLASPTATATFTQEPAQTLPLPTTVATEIIIPTETPSPTPIPPSPTVEVVTPTENSTPITPVVPDFTPTAEANKAMSAANKPPLITSDNSITLAENTKVVIAAGTDAPSQSLTYSISGGADSALFNINSLTGELTFVTPPDFETPTDSGADNVYNLTVQATDGVFVITQNVVITVTAVNENNPVITSNSGLFIAENSMTVMTITATDTDLPAQLLTYSIAGGVDSALFGINSSTGELTFITTPDFETPADASSDNIYNVTVQVSDGTLVTTQDVVVTVTEVNDNTPTITSVGNLSIVENTMAATTVTATDADLPVQPLIYSIPGGPDSAFFSINSSTGELNFIATPDFEIPNDSGLDNIYNVTVQVSDGTLASTQEIVVTVTEVNDSNPVVTSSGNPSIAENTTNVTTVTATDADLPTQSLTYSVVGGADSAFFSINPSTGELTFVTAPDFEAPADSGADNVYNLKVQVSDGVAVVAQDVVIAVTAVNENGPVITSNDSLASTEKATVVITVTAADADLPTQSLAYSIAGGADSALFNIDSSTGELSFVTAPDFDDPADSGLDNTYNITVQVSDRMFTSTQDIAITVNKADQ